MLLPRIQMQNRCRPEQNIQRNHLRPAVLTPRGNKGTPSLFILRGGAALLAGGQWRRDAAQHRRGRRARAAQQTRFARQPSAFVRGPTGDALERWPSRWCVMVVFVCVWVVIAHLCVHDGQRAAPGEFQLELEAVEELLGQRVGAVRALLHLDVDPLVAKGAEGLGLAGWEHAVGVAIVYVVCNRLQLVEIGPETDLGGAGPGSLRCGRENCSNVVGICVRRLGLAFPSSGEEVADTRRERPRMVVFRRVYRK